MSEMTRDYLLGVVRDVWSERDPVPDGLVARMQLVLATEDTDLDYELMLLVERSQELAGARGGTAYTLQFRHHDMSLLVRAATAEDETGTSRLDGWLAPAVSMRVRATKIEPTTVKSNGTPPGVAEEWEVEIDERGRFEFQALPPGLFRLWLTPQDVDAAGAQFGTPAFEL